MLRDMQRGPLTHVDADGHARMVDVTDKAETVRTARARALVRMSPETLERVRAGDLPKGDVRAVARLAAIGAAKRTDELIPLCHGLPLSHLDCDFDVGEDGVVLTTTARTTARTGVEMEALTAAAVGALAVYDMVKGVERGVTIERIELLEKTGGKEDWRRA
jgi:cyclic pyranopterin monophosphate synthase